MTSTFSAAPGRSHLKAKIEPLLTKRQAAELLGCCPRSIDNFVRQGKLRLTKIGTNARINPQDLRDFIDSARKSVA